MNYFTENQFIKEIFVEVFSQWKIHIFLLWVYLIKEKTQGHLFQSFFFRLNIPSISAFTSGNQVIYLSSGEEKEILGKNYFGINLSKSYCLKADFLKNSEKYLCFFLSWWLNGLYVGVVWVGDVFSRKTAWLGDTGWGWVDVDVVLISSHWSLGDSGWASVTCLGLPFPNYKLGATCQMFRRNGQHRHSYVNPCV